jgi:peptidoglycan/xylan/chitin deacetylase (PgdA/CDA1 family)
MSNHKALKFEVINKINAEEPTSWDSKVFLTFDVDWAHDDFLTDVIDLVEQYGIPATWFITHETPLNRRLRENPPSKFSTVTQSKFLIFTLCTFFEDGSLESL